MIRNVQDLPLLKVIIVFTLLFENKSPIPSIQTRRRPPCPDFRSWTGNSPPNSGPDSKKKYWKLFLKIKKLLDWYIKPFHNKTVVTFSVFLSYYKKKCYIITIIFILWKKHWLVRMNRNILIIEMNASELVENFEEMFHIYW